MNDRHSRESGNRYTSTCHPGQHRANYFAADSTETLWHESAHAANLVQRYGQISGADLLFNRQLRK
jgi:hypothetical protein